MASPSWLRLELTGSQAESYLKRMGMIPGDFVVRQSTRAPNAVYAISHVISDETAPGGVKVLHTRVFQTASNKLTTDNINTFDTLDELVQHFMVFPIGGQSLRQIGSNAPQAGVRRASQSSVGSTGSAGTPVPSHDSRTSSSGSRSSYHHISRTSSGSGSDPAPAPPVHRDAKASQGKPGSASLGKSPGLISQHSAYDRPVEYTQQDFDPEEDLYETIGEDTRPKPGARGHSLHGASTSPSHGSTYVDMDDVQQLKQGFVKRLSLRDSGSSLPVEEARGDDLYETISDPQAGRAGQSSSESGMTPDGYMKMRSGIVPGAPVREEVSSSGYARLVSEGITAEDPYSDAYAHLPSASQHSVSRNESLTNRPPPRPPKDPLRS